MSVDAGRASGAPSRLTLPPDLSRLSEVRAWAWEAGSAASLPEARIFDLQVTVSEATANAIEHAASAVELTAWLLPDRLVVEVTNDGVFQPGLYKDYEGRRRGLGLPLMVSLADHVSVSRMVGGKTRVSLTFFAVQRDSDRGLLGSAFSDGAKQSEPAWSFWRPASLIWLPLPLLIAAVSVFVVLGLDAVHEKSSVFTTFNILFIVAPMLIVSYLAARSYGRSRVQALVFLGAGSLLIGLAYLIGGPLITDPNHAITVADIAICAGSLCFCASAIQSVFERRGSKMTSRAPAIRATYVAVVVFMGVVIALTLAGLIPAFFIPGQGFTPWRNVSFGLAAAALVAAAFIFAMTYRRLRTPFLLWWLSGLGLMGAAFAIAIISQAPTASPVSWLVRSGQWLAGLYLLGGIFSLQHGEESSILPLERALRESEDRYKNLVDLSPDAITVDINGAYVFANPAAARLFGARSPQEMLGLTALDRIHADDRGFVRERMGQVQSGGVTPPAELRLLRLDGTPITVETSGSRVEFGGRLANQVVYRDLTERKRAEEELRESWATFAELVERSPFGTYVVDSEFRVAFMNTRSQTGAFRNVHPLIGRPFTEVMHTLWPDDVAEDIISHFRHTLETGEPYYAPRFTNPRHDVEMVESYEWELQRIALPDGQSGVICYYFDSTELRAVQDALQQRSQLLDLSSDAIFAWELDGAITYWNRGAERLYGFKTEEAVGRVSHDLLKTIHPQGFAPVRAALEGDGEWMGEIAHTAKDGSALVVETRQEVIPVEGRRLVLETNRDITERKQAEEALRESEERLRLALEAADYGTWDLDLVTGQAIRSLRHDQIFGYEELQPEWTMEIALRHVLPEDHEKVIEAHTPAEGKTEMYVEGRMRRVDGTTGWLMSTGRFRHDDQGRPVRIVGVCADITERKQAEEALRESEERYRTLAEDLQAAFLHIPSELGPVRLGHLYRSATEAARVGGDFYDVFEVKEGKIALLMGDVAGHGIEAARTATLVKDVVHAFIHQTLRPHEVLQHTNTLLIEKQMPGYVTLFLGILDPETGELRYSSAGHPDMLVRRASGEVEHLGAGSSPLGIYADPVWKPSAIELEADDLVVLFTDGVIEARRTGELFGEKRLETLIKSERIPAEGLPDVILDQVLTFSGGMLEDDLAILTLRLLTKDEIAPSIRKSFTQEKLLG